MLRKLALVMAISPAIWLSTASALGLGEIDVQSKLNQRLIASIPLTDLAPDEAETLQVGLAQGDAYEKAGLNRSDYLNTLSYTVVTDGGVPHIVIKGKQIAREPVLNILLDVRGRNGRIQRAFTVLLDPPDYAMPKPAAAPVAEEPAAAAPPVTPTKKSQKKSPETDAETSLVQSRTEAGTYGPVAVGETLWSIASRLRADPAITMDQMQLALYKANPKAFENGRIGSLLKGVTLKVPTEQTIKSVSADKARSRVQQLRAGHQEFQRRPDFNKPEISKTPKEPKAAAPLAEEPAPAPTPAPKTVAPAAPAAKPATAPASSPPKPAASPLEAKPAEPTPVVTPPPIAATPAKTPVAPVTPASAVVTAPVSAVAATAPASAVAGVAPAVETASATATAEIAASGAVAEPVSPVQAVEPVKPYIPPPIPAGPEPTPLMEELEGPIKLAGGVAVIAGLLGWILLSRKKKAKTAVATPRKPFNWQFWKKTGSATESAVPPKLKPGKKMPEAAAPPVAAFNEEEFEREFDATQKSSSGRFPSETQKLDQTLSVTDTAQLPNFDSTKIFDTPPDMALSGISTDAVDFDVTGKFDAETLKIDLNSNDPVAEADFHLAYGLYDEAALQLKQAAQQQPARTDIRTKLAEVYFRAGKAAEFQEVAQDLKPLLSQTEWTKVALMGKQLSPEAAMFQGVDTAALSTDVDMAFDEPTFAAAPAPAAKARSSPGVMDFELTSLDLPKVEEPKPVTTDNSNSLEFNLDDFSLDTPTLAAPAATPAKATAPAPVAAVDAPMEFDLSAFDIGTPDVAVSTTKLAKADEISLDDFDLSMPEEGHAISTGDEASTKLDLARAYVDMGDNDMARSLLNEVLLQGSAVQKTEAQALLSRLA